MNEEKKTRLIRLFTCILIAGCAAQMLFVFSPKTKIYLWTTVFLVAYVISYLLTGQISFFCREKKV